MTHDVTRFALRRWALRRMMEMERRPEPWGGPLEIVAQYETLLELMDFRSDHDSRPAVRQAVRQAVCDRFGSTNQGLGHLFKEGKKADLMEVLHNARGFLLTPVEQMALTGDEPEPPKSDYAYVREHRPDLYGRVQQIGLCVSVNPFGDFLTKGAAAEANAMSLVADLLREQEERK